jgi:hypothetical protein
MEEIKPSCILRDEKAFIFLGNRLCPGPALTEPADKTKGGRIF